MRRWFDTNGYLEIPTPVRVPSPALEPTLFAFAVEGGGYLRTSPELALKRVVSAGMPRVYEIGPCLRAREEGPWHSAEFLMLEWYRVGGTLADLMGEVEHLVAAVASALNRPTPERWRRHTVADLFRSRCGLDLAHARAADLSERDPDDWDTAFFRRFIEDIEPSLGGPCFVEGWPVSQAALATVRTDGHFARCERFEAYLGGVEIANAFQELGRADELRARWITANQRRATQGERAHPVDEEALDAIERLPRCAGIALGVERLVAALCGWSGIEQGQARASISGPRRGG